MGTIDLNSDLGESYGVWRLGDDEAMLEVVTSANVACGFHAGDPGTLRSTCHHAARLGVAIGAQVSYPDIAGFGRRRIEMEMEELRDTVLYQLGALDAFARAAGTTVAYVKPHGALYHATVDDRGQAHAVVAAVAEFDDSMPVLGLPGSELLVVAAEAGIDAVAEAFADRAYLPDGRLVPRSADGAVISDPVEVARRCVRLATDGVVEAIDGSIVRVSARSICVHGDTPGAVDLARAVRAELEAAEVAIESFT